MKDRHNAGRGLQQDIRGPRLKDSGPNSGPGDERSITDVGLKAPVWPSSSKGGPQGRTGPRDSGRGAARRAGALLPSPVTGTILLLERRRFSERLRIASASVPSPRPQRLSERAQSLRLP